MTVRITSPALGKKVGESYTGPLEAWLLNEGYATTAATLPDAWLPDADGVLGGAKPSVTLDPTPAVLNGGTNAAATVGTNGNVVFGTKWGVRTSVALLAADTAAQAATKIDTALAGLADAAIVSSKLRVTSVEEGPTAYVTVVDGTAAVLTALGVTKGQVAYGTTGQPVGAADNPTAAAEVDDPTVAENREAPYYEKTEDRNTTIANDAENLTKDEFPNPNFDFDAGGVEEEAPANLEVSPASGQAAGGTIVGLTGDNLTEDTTVTVGGAGVSEVYVTAGSKVIRIDFAVPAHAAGAVDVVVTNAVGSTTMTGGFTYTA